MLTGPKKAAWQQPTVTVYGQTHRTPRRIAFYADAELRYQYSGLTHVGHGWPSWLQPLKQSAQAYGQQGFNSVLINHYRDGNDSMGWHSDDEPELGENPCVLSMNLGATRRFKLRHKIKEYQTVGVDLGAGDVLLMDAGCQRYWQHAIPKTQRSVGERINLTFRCII